MDLGKPAKICCIFRLYNLAEGALLEIWPLGLRESLERIDCIMEPWRGTSMFEIQVQRSVWRLPRYRRYRRALECAQPGEAENGLAERRLRPASHFL